MQAISHTLPEFRVRFSETDMAGVAHFTSVLKWAENAESDFFRSRGLNFAVSDDKVVKGFQRTDLQAEFISPARYDDRISVDLKLLSQEESSLKWEFSIFALRGNEKLPIARGSYTTVYTEADVATGELRRIALPTI